MDIKMVNNLIIKKDGGRIVIGRKSIIVESF